MSLSAKLAKARDEVERIANLEHMHQTDKAVIFERLISHCGLLLYPVAEQSLENLKAEKF